MGSGQPAVASITACNGAACVYNSVAVDWQSINAQSLVADFDVASSFEEEPTDNGPHFQFDRIYLISENMPKLGQVSWELVIGGSEWKEAEAVALRTDCC